MFEKPTYKELEQRVRELEEAEVERRQMEDSLRENQRLMADIIENSGTLIVLKDCEGKYQLVNRKWEEVTGLNRESVLGKTDEMLFPPNIAREFRENDLHVIESGSVVETEEFLENSSGTRYFISNKFPIINDAGTTTGLCGIITEITARKRAEEAVNKSESIQRKMVANIGDVIVIIDRNGINRYKSPNSEKLFGWTPEDVVGISAWKNIHPEDLEAAQIFFRNLMSAPNTVGSTECRYKCKDGSFKWIEFTGSNLLHDPDINGILGNYHDITDRKLAEQDLFESETRFKALHNASFGGITIHDKGIILECNYGLSKITGYSVSELIGMDGLLLIAEQSRKLVMDNIVSGYEKPYEAVGLRKDGTEFPIRLEARNIPYKGKQVRTVEFRDITDQKQAEVEREKLQAQLIQAQKMESIGTLAGGIAHDFNNILFPILGHTEMLLEDVPKESPFLNGLNEIHSGALRAKGLVKQILTFSRQESSELKLLKIQPVIKEALNFIRATIPTTISIKLDIQADCGVIKADPTQIHQVIMNLVTNASHAMEDTGGDLSVRLKKIELGEYDLMNSNITPGNFACLKITDTGKGMDKELTKKIFDPFFTTKEKGKGTGMGLSVVHGIVTNMGGAIQVYSEPGKGTEFTIYVPVEKSYSEQNTTQVKKSKQVGNEHILLVDDEQSIIKMEELMLERLGYKITSHTSSIEALEAFRANPAKFDLIITDMAMPDLSGDKLAVELIKIRPDIPILLCTGYSENSPQEKAASLSTKGFLMKPIVMKDLEKKIREVLDGKKF